MKEINIKEAEKVLWDHHSEIKNVKDWIAFMNYSKEPFIEKVKEETGESPEKIFRRSKFRKLNEIILSNPEVSAVVLAREIGLRGIQELYDFIQEHQACSIREYKNQVLKENRNR